MTKLTTRPGIIVSVDNYHDMIGLISSAYPIEGISDEFDSHPLAPDWHALEETAYRITDSTGALR